MGFPVLSEQPDLDGCQELVLGIQQSFTHSPPALHRGSQVSFPLKNLESVSGHWAGIEPGNWKTETPSGDLSGFTWQENMNDSL